VRDYDAAGQSMQADSWSGNTEFFVPNSFHRMTSSAGRIRRLEIRPRTGMAEPAVRTERAVPARVKVPVNSGILEKHVGGYELTPNVRHTFHWARTGRSTKMQS
jgi:hypothetical protein